MSIFNNSPKVTSWLIRREIGFYSHERLKFNITQTIQNIAKDLFSSTLITFNNDTNLCKEIVRSQDFVAVRQGTSISLWNIFLGIKMWEYIESLNATFLSPRLEHTQILVDKDGLVAQIFRSQHPNEETYVEFFFGGTKTGSLYFRNFLEKFQLINGSFFARGIDSEPARESNGCLLKEKLYLYQWDKLGQLVHKISLAPFYENSHFNSEKNTVANENYLVSCFGTFMNPNVSRKVLVHNFKTESSEVFNLETSPYDQDITNISLLENRLIIGSNISKLIPGLGEKISDLKISVFNLVTNKIENEHMLEEEGNIRYLVANEKYTFFAITPINPSINSIKLFSLNLSNGDLHEILTLSRSIYNPLQLSIMNDTLSVCYSTGTWNGIHMSDRQVRIDFDIKSQKIINKIKYYRSSIENCYGSSFKLSFESGVFAFQFSEDKIQQIYLENYRGFYPQQSEMTFRVKKLT